LIHGGGKQRCLGDNCVQFDRVIRRIFPRHHSPCLALDEVRQPEHAGGGGIDLTAGRLAQIRDVIFANRGEGDAGELYTAFADQVNQLLERAIKIVALDNERWEGAWAEVSDWGRFGFPGDTRNGFPPLVKLEAPSGIEPLNEGFADPSLSHLGTAPWKPPVYQIVRPSPRPAPVAACFGLRDFPRCVGVHV
jgi:hypothetical protein